MSFLWMYFCVNIYIIVSNYNFTRICILIIKVNDFSICKINILMFKIINFIKWRNFNNKYSRGCSFGAVIFVSFHRTKHYYYVIMLFDKQFMFIYLLILHIHIWCISSGLICIQLQHEIYKLITFLINSSIESSV